MASIVEKMGENRLRYHKHNLRREETKAIILEKVMYESDG